MRACVCFAAIFSLRYTKILQGRGEEGDRREETGREKTHIFKRSLKGEKSERGNSISLGRCFLGDLECGNINNANERLGAGEERDSVPEERNGAV